MLLSIDLLHGLSSGILRTLDGRIRCFDTRRVILNVVRIGQCVFMRYPRIRGRYN